ncbi:MAG: sugar phosphate isomerase/epimerase family protein [Anaerolineae bacterium]
MHADLATDVAVTARAGYSALEVWAGKVDTYLAQHSLEQLAALFRSHDVAPATINSIEFIAFRGPQYGQIQARCEALCAVAEAIGCPTVVVVPSPTPDRSLTWEAVVAEYVVVLRDLSAIAAAHRVRLAFEFLGFGWCTVRTPRGAHEIVQRTDRDNVGMVLDAAHFYGGGGLLSEIDAIDPARLYAFHLDDLEDGPKEAITDARRVLPGRGVVPLHDICTHLGHTGYDGLCSIELFRPEYWAWDAFRLAEEARRAAIDVLTPHFDVE